MAAAHHISTSRLSLFCSPVTLIEAAWAKFTRFRMYHKTLNELSSLSRHELSDLGLNPSMLKRIAYQAAYENH